MGWAAIALLLSLPWLVPTHARPWTSFHADAVMALAAMPLLAWALLARPPRISVPIEALALSGLAAVPVVQRAFGLITFAADAWLSDFIAAEGLPADFAETALAICGPLAARIVADRGPPGQVVGVCGSQASGKSLSSPWLRH